MSSSQFKICPLCGMHAAPTDIRCIGCGHRFSGGFPMPAPMAPPAAPAPGQFGHPAVPGARYCPTCNNAATLLDPFCRACGAQLPPLQPAYFSGAQGQSQGMTGYAAQAPGLTQYAHFELARQYKRAKRTFTWTLLVGLFCFFWPLFIVTYLEYRKMQDIKEQVGLTGIDSEYWARTL